LVPECIQPIAAAFNPCYMAIGFPDRADGSFDDSSRADIAAECHKCDVVAIGPGLSVSTETIAIAGDLYADSNLPVVVDADALNAISTMSIDDPDVWSKHAAVRIVTPHPGEFARMTGRSIAEIAQDRERLAASFAKQHSVILVLKGEGTVITDGDQVFVNSNGNPGLATGGSGDVLTGVVAALLGQQFTPLEAARLAVWLHGRAGDLAAAELSEAGLIASDLPLFVAKAWKELEQASTR
jgi:NAD(P)H-hydrate epimerase